MWRSCVLMLCLVSSSFSWNFGNLNVTNDEISIIHVSLYYMRAFICLKSDDPYKRVPTLVESSWPETMLPVLTKPYPQRNIHNLKDKTKSSGACKKIIQSFKTAVDSYGYLWVLDNGNHQYYKHCPPKLIIFNLNILNEEADRFYFNEFNPNSITDFVLEKPKLSSYQNPSKGYFSIRDQDHIYSYSIIDQEFKKHKIQVSNPEIQINKPITVNSLAISESGLLFMYEKKQNNLYFADLRVLEGMGKLYTIKLGALIGKSHGLILDSEDNLYYILDRDGAVAKWQIKRPLQTEEHSLVHFQSQVFSQIFFIQNNVWILNEKPVDVMDLIHCIKIIPGFRFENKFKLIS